jgi:DNA ligase (NAD+)
MKQRILELRSVLNQAIHDYSVLSRPTMSDERYDQLFKELVDLEKAHPEFADDNSPTSRVGGPSISAFEKVNHISPMLSLENTFTPQEVVQYFAGKFKAFGITGDLGVCEPKIDGLALSLTYMSGELVRAVTRGDGSTGDDVTINVRTIRTVPTVLATRVTCEVRGEVFMPRSKFNALNAELEKQGDEPFANQRNAASGSLKLKDSKEVAKRGLSFIAYTLIGGQRIETQIETLVYLEKQGFIVDSSLLSAVSLTDVESVEAALDRVMRLRNTVEFDIDGAVFKCQSLDVQVRMGLNNRAPNWATSYKFPPAQANATLVGITVQVGRLGTLTPVAELSPTLLAGSTIRRASLHNYDEIVRLGVNIGDEVVIQKAAEIIPEVVSIARKNTCGVWEMPTRCPSCNGAVVKVPGQVAIRCTNSLCNDQINARLNHAVKKQCLDIDGCGEKTVAEMVNHGVLTLSELFTRTEFPFLGQALEKRVLKGLDKARTAPLWRKIHALGIDGIGITTSKELASRWTSVDAMLDDMEAVKEILGPVTFQSFATYFDNTANVLEIVSLVMAGVAFKEDRVVGILSGKSFCITGSMLSGGREDVSRKIESVGGTVKNSVSKKVNYLVVGEGAGHNKSAAAQKLGVTCLTEDELYAMMGLPFEIAAVAEIE